MLPQRPGTRLPKSTSFNSAFQAPRARDCQVMRKAFGGVIEIRVSTGNLPFFSSIALGAEALAEL